MLAFVPLAGGRVPFFGHTLEGWRDPTGLLLRATRELGDVARFRFGPLHFVLLNDTDALQHVLVKNASNYVKSRNYRGIQWVLGQGLLTSEGEFWRRQRKLAQPAFHPQHLAGFADTMVRLGREAVDRFQTLDALPLDLHAEMMRLTFRIVGATLFGADLEGEAHAIGAALNVALAWANDYAESVLRLPPWVPTPQNARFRRAMRTLEGLVQRIVDERRRTPGEHVDLLAMFMNATDESGRERMTDKELRDEVLTLVLAGHETTANALSFAFHLLSRHPDIERRLAQEIADALGDRAPTLADLPNLPFTDRVVAEALRLYPPVWTFEREAIADDVVAGHRILAGTTIGISPFALHRYTKYWTNPEGFDPDRFLPEASRDRLRFSYLPFGDGPRVCIGKSFALMETKLLLATILQRYRVDLVPGHALAFDAGITLRPRGGVWVRLVRRTPRALQVASARADARSRGVA